MPQKQLMTSEDDTWQTPPELLEHVVKMGKIGLDPCASMIEVNHFAAMNYTERDDGLKHTWVLNCSVFVNPPYGRQIGQWTQRCVDEYERGAKEIFLLVPARTDTQWFKHVWDYAQAVCFWEGRITFVGAEHPAPFPSAIAYYGDRAQRFATAFRGCGKVVLL